MGGVAVGRWVGIGRQRLRRVGLRGVHRRRRGRQRLVDPHPAQHGLYDQRILAHDDIIQLLRVARSVDAKKVQIAEIQIFEANKGRPFKFHFL